MRPTQVVFKPVWRQGSKPYNMKIPIPRMSWHVDNTFNIWQRTSPDSPLRRDITFAQSSRTLFQQRFVAKRFLKGYHAHMIRTKKFERWYLPSRLPAIHVKPPSDSSTLGFVEGRERAGGRTREEKFGQKKKEAGMVPMGSLMYGTVERRLDVCVHRACFAESVYTARRAVLGGNVKLNGQIIRNANTLLNPGDIFTVNPKVISFLKAPAAEKPKAVEEDANEEEVEESEESAAENVVTAESTETTSASSSSSSSPSETASQLKNLPQTETSWFNLPPYAQAHLFVPAYLQPSFLTCSAVYVRHPTARANYSEIPSPYDAGGELMSLGWEWYKKKAPRMRSKVYRWWNPQQSKLRKQIPRPDVDYGLAMRPQRRDLKAILADENKKNRSRIGQTILYGSRAAPAAKSARR